MATLSLVLRALLSVVSVSLFIVRVALPSLAEPLETRATLTPGRPVPPPASGTLRLKVNLKVNPPPSSSSSSGKSLSPPGPSAAGRGPVVALCGVAAGGGGNGTAGGGSAGPSHIAWVPRASPDASGQWHRCTACAAAICDRCAVASGEVPGRGACVVAAMHAPAQGRVVMAVSFEAEAGGGGPAAPGARGPAFEVLAASSVSALAEEVAGDAEAAAVRIPLFSLPADAEVVLEHRAVGTGPLRWELAKVISPSALTQEAAAAHDAVLSGQRVSGTTGVTVTFDLGVVTNVLERPSWSTAELLAWVVTVALAVMGAHAAVTGVIWTDVDWDHDETSSKRLRFVPVKGGGGAAPVPEGDVKTVELHPPPPRA